MIKDAKDNKLEIITQIAAIHTQNAVGYIVINKDFSSNNQEPSAKNNECMVLNIELKSAIDQITKAKSPNRIIRPVQNKVLPNALLPQKTNSKTRNKIAKKLHIPKAILIFAKTDATSSKWAKDSLSKE